MKFVKNSQPNSFNILASAMGHINFNDQYVLDLFKSSEIQLKELKSSLLILSGAIRIPLASNRGSPDQGMLEQ